MALIIAFSNCSENVRKTFDAISEWNRSFKIFSRVYCRGSLNDFSRLALDKHSWTLKTVDYKLYILCNNCCNYGYIIIVNVNSLYFIVCCGEVSRIKERKRWKNRSARRQLFWLWSQAQLSAEWWFALGKVYNLFWIASQILLWWNVLEG